MNDESADYELPVNQRIVGEVVYDHGTDETAIQTEDGLITFQSLVKGLACLEGYKLRTTALATPWTVNSLIGKSSG